MRLRNFSLAIVPFAQPHPIWTVIYRDPSVVLEIDRAHIGHHRASTADAWTRITYTKPDTLDDGTISIGQIQHAVYDCVHHRYIVGQMVVFDASGRIVKVSSTRSEWSSEPEGSIAFEQGEVACTPPSCA
jgi:hypothetical protein